MFLIRYRKDISKMKCQEIYDGIFLIWSELREHESFEQRERIEQVSIPWRQESTRFHTLAMAIQLTYCYIIHIEHITNINYIRKNILNTNLMGLLRLVHNTY